jgi:hypothetical protein
VDTVAVDKQTVAINGYLTRKAAVGGIELSKMGMNRDVTQVINGNNLYIIPPRLIQSTQNTAPNAAVTVYGNLYRQGTTPQ